MSVHDEGPRTSLDLDADAYAALLRREQQLDGIQRSFGWRLLSAYGPYKRRFVLPAWRALRARATRWLGREGDRSDDAYDRWARFADRFRAPTGASGASGTELVSLVMTLGGCSDVDGGALVASLVAQQHAAWELSVALVGDDGHGDVRSLARRAGFPCDDPRIRLDDRPYASEATALGALLGRTRGDVVAVVDANLAFAADALRVVVEAFRTVRCDVLYSDEDHRDDAGVRHTPRFLPAWSPDRLLSEPYWSRVAFYRRDLIAALVPLESELDGAHAYDLALRATEREVGVAHVPRVLAHVRAAQHGGRDGVPFVDGGAVERALTRALARRGIRATVEPGEARTYRVRRATPTAAKVSIVIPTRDGFAMLRRCLAAVERTDHPDFEVLIVDNGSRDRATLAFLAETRHRVLHAPGPFNFARLNNDAVRAATGRYVLFLNDDTEPCDPGWLSALEEHAQRPEVGAVGAKLLYADGRLQHAGIAVGIGGIAGHPYRFRREAPGGIRDVSAVTAACLMMRRETFTEVGGFDERLPVNSNDVDLCLRLRARGLLVVYTPYAVLRHFESQTRGGRAIPDDAWLMNRRWRGVLRSDPYWSPNLDVAEESGTPVLEKPDGFTCLYPGPSRADGILTLDSGERVGQRFFSPGDDLAAIVLRVAVSGDTPDTALRLVVRESPESAVPVRIVTTSIVGRSEDERWFCFEAIPDSGDRFWYAEVEVAAGHTVAFRRANVASDVMGPCWQRGTPAYGTLQFRLYARAPVRCMQSA